MKNETMSRVGQQKIAFLAKYYAEPWWANQIFLGLTAVLMSICDGVLMFNLVDAIGARNMEVTLLLTLTTAFLVNVCPSIAGSLYGRRKKMDINATIALLVALLLLTVLFLIRVYSWEINLDPIAGSLVSYEAEVARAKITTVLMGLQPVCTSALCFVLGSYTSDEVRRNQRLIARERVLMDELKLQMKAELFENEQAISEKEEELEVYEVSRAAGKAAEVEQHIRLRKCEVKLELAHKLQSAGHISYLSEN